MDRVDINTTQNVHAPDGSRTELSTTKARKGVTGAVTHMCCGSGLVVIAFAAVYFVMLG